VQIKPLLLFTQNIAIKSHIRLYALFINIHQGSLIPAFCHAGFGFTYQPGDCSAGCSFFGFPQMLEANAGV
jgi:hypothetical protein